MPAKFDVSAALRAARRLDAFPKAVAQIETRVTADLSRALPAEAVRDITEEFALTPSRVRKGLRTRAGKGYVELIGSDVGIGLAQGYRGKQTRGGVVVTIRKDEGPVVFKHAFIQIPGGAAEGTGPQAFEREGRGAPRYPVDRLFSQNVAGMLRDAQRAERLANFSMKRLSAEVARQLKVLAQ